MPEIHLIVGNAAIGYDRPMRFPSIAFLATALAVVVPGPLDVIEAKPRQLIKNGNFERRLNKWKIQSSDPSQGWIYADGVGSPTPLSGHLTKDNRRGGRKYAVTDQLGASWVLMRQKFRIPRGARTVILNYQMFADSLDPVIQLQNAFNLDKPNQQARVDLLKGGARAKDLQGGVVRKLYTKGADTVEAPNPPRYRKYRINLSRDVKPGRNYQIRFSVTATEDELILGVDNVSIKAR